MFRPSTPRALPASCASRRVEMGIEKRLESCEAKHISNMTFMITLSLELSPFPGARQ